MIDLNKKIPGAESFTYGEFVKSDVALRRGIKNIPTDQQWGYIQALAVGILQPVRNEFGPIKILSGFRSVELCLAVGSSATSNHARGQAADIEPINKDVRLIDIAVFIVNNLDFREIILEYFPDGWLHVAYRREDNNRQIKLKDNTHNYDRINFEYLVGIYNNINP